MGDPLRYPEIHSQRFLYAMKYVLTYLPHGESEIKGKLFFALPEA